MPIVTETVKVAASKDKKREDTGTITPGIPEYEYQAIKAFEGDKREFVKEALTSYFKGDLEAFNAFLTEALNRKLRIDGRPGMDAVSKLVAKVAKELGKTPAEVRTMLNLPPA